MLVVIFIIGILASLIGALPLGASNLAVINTTIKQNAREALKIAVAAGIAEIVLSYYALHCNMFIHAFFEKNQWIQILIALVLLTIGLFLLFKTAKSKTMINRSFSTSNYVTGFLLGLLNPPVLIYWILAFGIINNNNIMLSFESPLSVLFIFFLGVFLGKLGTLYIYSRFSIVIKKRFQNINYIINRVTGIILLAIAIVQAVKWYAL